MQPPCCRELRGLARALSLLSEIVTLASQAAANNAGNARIYVNFGGNECALRAMRAGEQGFRVKEQSAVSLNSENLGEQIIVETKKVLVVCERWFGEVCKCLRMFLNI